MEVLGMIRIGVPAMSYVEQWNAIAARIRALRDAADLYAQFLIAQNGQDTYTVGKKSLIDQSRSI